MNLTPVNGHYLVEENARPEQTEGGVFLPEDARHADLDEGTIIAAADDLPPVDRFAEGDVIIYRKYGGCEVQVDARTLVLVPHKNVLAFKR